MRHIKLIATDMDGTLLNSKKEKPHDFDEWILSHPDIKMVIASGRQYFALKNDFNNLIDNIIFIAENGGLVFDKDKLIYSNPISDDDVKKSLDIIYTIPNATPLICGAKAAYMNPTNDEIIKGACMYYDHLELVDDLYSIIGSDPIVKIAIYIDDEKAEEVYNSLPPFPSNTKTVLSSISWFDVANISCDKGAALKEIMKWLKIDRKNCMAFGDYMNDYELLLACEESYAMENGHPKLKESAKYIAPSNDDEGVMQIIRQL